MQGSHLPHCLTTAVIQALHTAGLSRDFSNTCSFSFTLISVIFQLFIFAVKKKNKRQTLEDNHGELKFTFFFPTSFVGSKAEERGEREL